jgi:hypothetical protein
MTDEYEDARTPQGLAPQTLALTKDQVIEYALAKECLRPCEACGNEEWDFLSLNEEPAIFTVSSARDKSYANWYFEFNCRKCGNRRSLSAGYVWSYFYERKDGTDEA